MGISNQNPSRSVLTLGEVVHWLVKMLQLSQRDVQYCTRHSQLREGWVWNLVTNARDIHTWFELESGKAESIHNKYEEDNRNYQGHV